jgi:hypothetical protein
MKGYDVSAVVLVGVMLFAITIFFFYNFFFINPIEVTPAGYVYPTRDAECSTKTDCGIKGYCMSINGDANACMCFDDADCSGGKRCLDKRCVS